MTIWVKQAATAAAVATTLAATLPAEAAATDVFIKIAEIKGESADAKHKGEIDVLSWSWGTSQSVSSRASAGASAGKPVVQELVITKVVDASSPVFIQYATLGRHIPEVLLTVRIAGRSQQDFIRIKLKDVFISTVKLNGTNAQALPMEEIGLNFGAIEFTVIPGGASGQAGTPVTTTYNYATGKP